jgi:hypothetical protein
MTTATPPAVLIGHCVRCEKLYRSAGTMHQSYCDCRATVPCDCFADEPGHFHPQTFIKYATVKATKTVKACDEKCQSAKSLRCACACGGVHHGEAWGAW